MTYDLRVQIDLHDGVRPLSPRTLARAVYRAIEHVLESDIAGAEVLDERIGQVSVTAPRVWPWHLDAEGGTR